jgi:hypothetical protein
MIGGQCYGFSRVTPQAKCVCKYKVAEVHLHRKRDQMTHIYVVVAKDSRVAFTAVPKMRQFWLVCLHTLRAIFCDYKDGKLAGLQRT